VRLLILLALVIPTWVFSESPYERHCASCHGADRLGGMGPALLPESLARLKKPEAARMIRDSRPGVQMPAFASTLSAKEIDALVELLYSPVVPAPKWGAAEIRASRLEQAKVKELVKPAFAADPLNLFVVVEAGDHHITTLDGVRVDYPKGWGLVRASNTTPVLVLRFEAETEEELKRIQEVFRAQLYTVAPDLTLPF